MCCCPGWTCGRSGRFWRRCARLPAARWAAWTWRWWDGAWFPERPASLRRLALCPLERWHPSPTTEENFSCKISSWQHSYSTWWASTPFNPPSSPILHLQSSLVEHFSSLQDAAAAGHRVLNDQTYVPLTEGALHQTLGSWQDYISSLISPFSGQSVSVSIIFKSDSRSSTKLSSSSSNVFCHRECFNHISAVRSSERRVRSPTLNTSNYFLQLPHQLCRALGLSTSVKQLCNRSMSTAQRQTYLQTGETEKGKLALNHTGQINSSCVVGSFLQRGVTVSVCL